MAVIPGLVTTIIPVYNRPKLLSEAVESVLAQTHRPIEIIIVNDGSTDETGEVADGYCSRFRDIVQALHKNNGGPGAARESGRQLARGEYIQYLDSDDLLLPKKFECQVGALKNNLPCAVSYGKTRYYRIGDVPNNIAHKRTGERIETMFPAFLQSRWWSTSTPLFRRDICDRAGPWLSLSNEEDWEYDCRIAGLGVRLHYCGQFISDTRDHDDQRLCKATTYSPGKLRDRMYAHELIYRHAIESGICEETSEMQHFSRELFLLSRQCGRAGLSTEAKKIFLLAREASGKRGKKAEFIIYELLANVLGWARLGALCCKLDEFRPKVT